MSVFAKAGVPSWKALVPGLNFYEICLLVGRPGWQVVLILVPVLNIFFFWYLCVELVRSFNRLKFSDSAMAVIYPPYKFFQIGKSPQDQYVGPSLKLEREYYQNIKKALESGDTREHKRLLANNPYKKGQAREWVEAVVFAVFAAAFIRMFLIEAFVIPTPSMEGSLLVGDFLFVSKVHYGLRTPMTVLQVPLAHNVLPLVGGESYLKNPSLPYYRTPGISKVLRNDPVVFNYPEGDSVFVNPLRVVSIYDTRRSPTYAQLGMGLPLRVRPIDKRDHYIKRCVGIPGDTIRIVNRQLFIDGKPAINPREMQYKYTVKSPNSNINKDFLDEIGVNLQEIQEFSGQLGQLSLTEEQKAKLLALDKNIVLEPLDMPHPEGYLFPQNAKYYGKWTMDNYGPLVVPAKGMTVELNEKTWPMYDRIIRVYDNNDVKIENGKYIINGVAATTYTFKQNYYWMMGDNRHNSEDSRFWGFLPEDHIVGKPLFIFFSTKGANIANGIRFKRIFTGATKMD